MTVGFITLGIVHILYYGLLVWYTRRWNGTFMWFWPVSGVLLITLGVLVHRMPPWGDAIVRIVYVMAVLIFIFVMLLITLAMIPFSYKEMDYIVILGARVRGTTVTETLRRRLDRAVRYLERHPNTVVIVSGGKGKDEEISEADAMAMYLQNYGVSMRQIRIEKGSHSTYENFQKSLAFIHDVEMERVGIVTNNFHMFRARRLAKLLGYNNNYAITASCNPITFPNYMMREFFAVVVWFLKIQKSKPRKQRKKNKDSDKEE